MLHVHLWLSTIPKDMLNHGLISKDGWTLYISTPSISSSFISVWLDASSRSAPASISSSPYFRSPVSVLVLSMLKRSFSNKSKKVATNTKSNRILVSINVLGSTGPIRFVVYENDLVYEVIKTTLASYARLARLPILGTNVDNFILYCVNDEMDALNPRDIIGSKQVRHFLLCKKQGVTLALLPNEKREKQMEEEKGRNHWKTWLNKSLSYNIPYYYMF